jgi:hypothetical protein
MCLDSFSPGRGLVTVCYEHSNKAFSFTDVTYKSLTVCVIIPLWNKVSRTLLLMNFINTEIIQVPLS